MGGDIIDACAAPGNKTSHMAALIKESAFLGKSRIFAFDKSVARCDLLKARLENAAADNVTAVNADFLSLEPSDPRFGDVTAVLVDPSCSGSGV